MKEMTDEEIKNCLYGCMVFFDEVCRKYNIKYFLSDGTLLGAIRHKDFIPWDNDADVSMDRENYNKLFEAMQKETPNSNYELLTYFSDEYYFYPFYKLVDKRTKCDENTFKENKNMGVFLDIFPLDYVPDDPAERTALIKKMDRLRHRFVFKCLKSATFLKNLVKRVLTLFVNTKKAVRRVDEECQKCPKSNTVCPICWSDNFYPKHYFDELIEVKFRDHYFYSPKMYDVYLTKHYGDYMTPPPVEERCAHNYKAYWRD